MRLCKCKAAYARAQGHQPQLSPRDATVCEIKPLGLAFLFDRLLPAYQIDPAHYGIESYFKRMSLSQMPGMTPPPPTVRRMFFFEWPVEQVTSRQEINRIETWLRVLRLAGVVFAVFLPAVISALEVH